MKRELAALESGSLVLDSIGRKTRSSKQLASIDSNGVLGSLMRKRVKKRSEIEEAELVSNSSNEVVEDLKDHRLGSSNVIHDMCKEATESLIVAKNSLIVENVTNTEVEIRTEDNGSMINLSEEDCRLMNMVQNDNGKVNNSSDSVMVNTVNANVTVNGNSKNSSVERYQKRFTRSALKSKVDIIASDSVVQNEENANELVNEYNAEFGQLKEASNSVIPDKGNTELVMIDENAEVDLEKGVEESISVVPNRNLEMKMSKQIVVSKIPTTVKELLETGLLEGCLVYYNGGKGPGLRGRIKGIGILCPCGLCQGCKVIPPSLFEIHACKTYRRAAQYIYLENGRNFIQILKTCKKTRLNTLEATIQNAIGPLPEKKLIVCENCKEPFSTRDAKSSEAVCSSCVMSNLSPIGPVYSYRKPRRSFKPVCSLNTSQTGSECDVPPDRSREKSIENEKCEPMLHNSPRFEKSSEIQTSEEILKSTKPVCSLSASQTASECDVLPDRSHEKAIEKSPEAFRTPKLRSSPRFEKPSEIKTSEEILNSQEAFRTPKTCRSPLMGKSSETKTCDKLVKKSFNAALSPKLSGSTRAGKSSLENNAGKKTRRLKKEVLPPKPSKSPSVYSSSEKRTSGKITRKDLRQHRVVFEEDILPDGTELAYYAQGQKLLDGYKKGSGIFCNCCHTVVSASQFEAHAGCAGRRKPYCYIYTSNGVSLHELSITLIKGRSHSAKFNDDLCSICADGGNLLLCDGCPRAFHMECASLSSIPQGKWYCNYCQNMFEREKFVANNANALAAGRVSGVDPIEQITTRSIRIVSNVASEVSSCILCRGFDFCKSGFGPRTIILCDQCEKEYHVGCLKDHKMADLTELPEGKWFCSMDCGRIESALQNLLIRGAEKLPESLVGIIRKKHMENSTECETDFDVSWRLLSGKIVSPETRLLLSQAVAIFHESFAPIIDAASGHDLIPAMVYGRNAQGQEYGGMYCAVITVKSVVVSAGIFRVFGPEVAELPLVATSSGNHGKGYFQTLFACIERLLAFLKVKSFVLPSAEEAESIWTHRFGFTKMTPDQLCEFKRNYWSMVRFQGTSMLHKLIPECRVIQTQQNSS